MVRCASDDHREAISRPSLSHSELPKSLAVLFEIRGRIVVNFVLLEKGVDLHPRLESKKPPKGSLGSQPFLGELSLPSGSRLPDNRRPCSASLAAFTTISPSPPAEVSGMVPAGKPRYGLQRPHVSVSLFWLPSSSRPDA